MGGGRQHSDREGRGRARPPEAVGWSEAGCLKPSIAAALAAQNPTQLNGRVLTNGRTDLR